MHPRLHRREHLRTSLLDAFGARVHPDVGLDRRLVRVVDAGEVPNGTLPGLGVEALRIALLAIGQRGGDVHFDVVAAELPDEIPRIRIG